MLIEQLLFTIISFILFMLIFYRMLKKNTTRYIPILLIEAIGIAINFIEIIFRKNVNIGIKVVVYILAIGLPILIILLERKNSSIFETMRIFLAKVYLVFGNTKKAKEQLIKLVTEEPNNYLGHKLLAEIYEKEGGIRKAVDEYVQAIDVNKTDYNSYFKIATLLTELDKKEEAAQMLANLLNKKPDYMEASIKLGDLLIEQEMYKEAANVYGEALKFNPTSFELNYNLGIVYTMLNDFQNARLYYEKSAQLNTLVYNTKYSLAEIALIYKELEEAEKYFLQATEDEELAADAYLELAKISLIKCEKDKAIRYANIAIDDSPRKSVEKIKKDMAFVPIIAKLSIPFNLDIEEEKEQKLTKKEIKSKVHLEQMAEITKHIGYNDIKKLKENKEIADNDKQIQYENEKEIE